MYKIVLTSYHREPNENVARVFAEAGMDYQHIPCLSEEETIRAAQDADALLVWTIPPTTRRIMEALPELKLVGRSGVGVDSIDLRAATELGICVTNTPGINTSEVADHAMAILLSITRQIPQLSSATLNGAWTDSPQQLSPLRQKLRRIAGANVGIYGLGNIGKAFAQRIRGFGPGRILAHDPYIRRNISDLYGVDLVDFDTLLTESDFITIHAPATADNYHAFDADAYAKMKPSAILINCARGPIVDEVALAQALKSGQIYAAGIDVTEVEPLDPESPLFQVPNLTITPHVAGGSDYTAKEGSIRWAENPVNLFTGKPLHGLANPEVVETIAIMRDKGASKWDNIPSPQLNRGF